jgi:putative Ca2+/H+ antiporter (TMEM165/GDT1 family)
MLAADGLVVFGGSHLTRLVSQVMLRRAAATLFLVLGLVGLVGALAWR